MLAVWKYELPPQDETEIELPAGAAILTVQGQRDTLCLWALVDTERERERRRFQVVGTGHRLAEHPRDMAWLSYIGSAQLHDGALVFHVFERFASVAL